MKLLDYVDKVEYIDIEELKNKKLNDLIILFHTKSIVRFYILKDKKPIFVLTPKEIVDIFLNNLINADAYEFFKDKDYLKCFDVNKHIIDVYYEMRKNNLLFMPVCKNNEFIGEVDFNTLSLKITYIVIKDELTGVYNKKYFDVLIEEYKDFNKPMGLIFIELKDLAIFEGLYGIEMSNKMIINVANILKNSVRKIDFVFRWDNQFRIIIFNNLEVTAKILERITKKLNNTKIDGIKIPFNICLNHIPELNSDILMAIEECEEKLIKRD